jgi:hypothetical protein
VSRYAPQLLDVLNERMQNAYMEIADKTPGNPILPKIHSLVRRARELKGYLTSRHS